MASKEKDKKSEKAIDQRPNYFAGQYLLEDDFKLEQKYHIDRQRRHNRLLHVSGIAEGLKVSPDEDKKVKVSAGTAIDSQGRQIILPDDQFVELENVANKKPLEDGGYTLYIRYEEEQTEKQDSEESMARRVQETPKFELSNEESKSTSPDVIPLAKLTIVGGKVKNDENIDLSVRQYSGICLPTEDGKGVTLRSHDEENNRAHGDDNPNLAVLTGSLSISGTLAVKESIRVGENETGVTLRSPGGNPPKTAMIEGSISISGKVEITEDCDMKGNLTVERGLLTVHSLRIGLATEAHRVNRIVNNINEREQENETSIPTNAAVQNYVDRRIPEIKKTYRRYDDGTREIEVSWEGTSLNFVVPMTMLLVERLQIKTSKENKKRSTLMKVEGKIPSLTIEETEDGWDCKIDQKEATKGNRGVLLWTEEFVQGLAELVNNINQNRGESEKIPEIVRENMGFNLIYEEKYSSQWEYTRKRCLMDEIIEMLNNKNGNSNLDKIELIQLTSVYNNDMGGSEETEISFIYRSGVVGLESKVIVTNKELIEVIYKNHEIEQNEIARFPYLIFDPPVWKALLIVSQ